MKFKLPIYIFFIILSAFILALASFSMTFSHFNIGIIIPFALIPFFYSLDKLTCNNGFTQFKIGKKVFLWSWFFGFCFQLVAFFWITKPIMYFGSVPSYFAYPIYILIAFMCSIYFAFLFIPFSFYLIFKHKFSNKTLFIFPIACLITLFEIYIPSFFDWSFGSLLSTNVYYNQLESLFGFNTGSLFIFYISLSIYVFISKANYIRNLNNLILPILVLVCVILFGYFRIQKIHSDLKSTHHVQVGFVQPNFTFSFAASLPLPSHEPQKLNFQTMMNMSQNLIHFTQASNQKLDLIVWPESTAPSLFFYTPWQVEGVQNLSLKSNIPFLIQSLEVDPQEVRRVGFDNAKIWSSSAVIHSNGIGDKFQKWMPMPFGEEFPFEHIFPQIGIWYRNVFKNASKIERGTNFNALPINDKLFVTPLICFDAIDQRLSYLSNKFGNTSLFINQANFVWMVDSYAAYELSVLDQMRAIENGKSVLIASNTGPSFAMNPLGEKISLPTNLLSQGLQSVEVPLYFKRTLFSYVYHWPLDILGLFSFIYCFIKYRNKNLNVK